MPPEIRCPLLPPLESMLYTYAAMRDQPPPVSANGADELQDEVRAAFSQSPFGRSVADRVGRRLLLVRSPDDLVDLAANLTLLLTKPDGKDDTWQGHGRDRSDGMTWGVGNMLA